MSKIQAEKSIKWQEKLYFEDFSREVDSYDAKAFQFIRNRCRLSNLAIEIGSGSGAWTVHLTTLGRKVIGLDISSSLIKKMYKRLKTLNCEAVVGDAEFLPFKNKVADCCFFFFSLHHVPDTLQAINEATRCLRDNGQLVIVEPNGLNFMLALIARVTSILKLVNKAGLTSPAERPLNVTEIMQKLSELGFKCYVFSCNATLRKKKRDKANSSILTRIYLLFLNFSASIFPNIFGASDFILFAERIKSAN